MSEKVRFSCHISSFRNNFKGDQKYSSSLPIPWYGERTTTDKIQADRKGTRTPGHMLVATIPQWQ